MVQEDGCSIPSVGELRVICHNTKPGPVPSLWSSKESVKFLCLVQPSRHRGGAAGPQGGAGCVQSHPVCGRVRDKTQALSFPGCLSVHSSMLLVISVAAASSRLGFCPVHPCSAETCTIPPRRALTAAESVSSFARWGRGARDPWSLPTLPFPDLFCWEYKGTDPK